MTSQYEYKRCFETYVVSFLPAFSCALFNAAVALLLKGCCVAAWRWRHMYINGHRWMVPISNESL